MKTDEKKLVKIIGKKSRLVLRKLHRAKRKKRFVSFVSSVFLGIAALALLFLVVFGIDEGYGLSKPLRMLTFAVIVLATLFVILVFFVYPLVKKIDIEELALKAEEAYPALGGGLISAIQLARQTKENPSQFSLEMTSRMESHIINLTKRLSFTRIISAKPVLRNFLLMLVAAVPVFLFVYFNQEAVFTFINRLLNPFGITKEYLSRTKFEVITKDVTLLRGEPLDIEARCWKGIPDEGWLYLGEPESDNLTQFKMKKVDGEHFVYSFERVTQSFSYFVNLGDARSINYRVTVVPPPVVTEVRATLTYPQYLKKPIQTLAGGDIKALTGTQVHLEIVTNKLVKDAGLTFAGSATAALQKTSGLVYGYDFTVEESTTYQILLADEYGYTNDPPVRYSVEALVDEGPAIAITGPEDKLEIVAPETLPVGYTAQDDFGIADVTLTYSIMRNVASSSYSKDLTTGGTLQLPVNAYFGKTDVTSRYDWDVTGLALNVGDSIKMMLACSDIHKPEANVAKSKTITVTITDRAEKEAEFNKKVDDVLKGLELILKKQIENKSGVDTIIKEVQ